MSEWQSKPLDEVVEHFIDYRGKTPNKTDSGVPLITAKIVKNGGLLTPFEFIAEDDYLEWMTRGFPEINDVVLTTEAPLGEVALIKDENVALAQRIITLRGYPDQLHNVFLKYWLQSEYGQYELDSRASGTTVFGIKASVLKKMPVPVPPLPEQKAIADVLSALDDKIDLLQRQNETLEKMAETMFRQWFIEEAKEDWEEVTLDDICHIQNGYAFSSRDYIPLIQDELEVLKMGHIDKNCTLKVNPKRDYVPREQKLDRYILNEDDIVLAMTDMKDNVAILGIPALIDVSNRYVLNQRVARITLRKDSKLKSVYSLFLQLKDSVFIEILRSKANSGVQVNLSTQAIKDSCLVIPPHKNQIEVEPIFSSIYGKVKNNNLEIQTLQNLRDTLLPKLMSGEVRVKLN